MADELITVELAPDDPSLAANAAQETSPEPSPTPEPAPAAPLTAAERLRQLADSDKELAAELEREANARASRALNKRQEELQQEQARRQAAEAQTKQWAEYERLSTEAESEDYETRQKAIEALAQNEKARIQRDRFLRDTSLQQALMQDVSMRYFDQMRQSLLSDESLKGLDPRFVEETWQTSPSVGTAVARIADKKYEGWISPKDLESRVTEALAVQRTQLMGELPTPDTSRGAPVSKGARTYEMYSRDLRTLSDADLAAKWTSADIDRATSDLLRLAS